MIATKEQLAERIVYYGADLPDDYGVELRENAGPVASCALWVRLRDGSTYGNSYAVYPDNPALSERLFSFATRALAKALSSS